MGWGGIEKRRFVRANFPCIIIIYTPKQHSISTHTENIGAGGVRVIIEEKLEINDVVGLEIFLYKEKQPIECKGKVVWVVEKESLYRKNLIFCDIGIEFYSIKEGDKGIIKNLIETIVVGKNDPGKD